MVVRTQSVCLGPHLGKGCLQCKEPKQGFGQGSAALTPENINQSVTAESPSVPGDRVGGGGQEGVIAKGRKEIGV